MEIKCNKCDCTDSLEYVDKKCVTKYYEKVENKLGCSCTKNGGITITITKYLCTNCGNVFEVPNEDGIKKYKEYKEYFI